MSHDYFYSEPPDGFAFYRIPKALFTDARYGGISVEAKLLYGFMMDRISLSQKKEWFDKQGRVFIIFTLKQVMESIGCADNKATKLLKELEEKADLIERKRRGKGKADLIFVKNFVDNPVKSDAKFQKTKIQSREICDSGLVNFTTLDSSNSRRINTEIIKTDSDIHPIPSGFPTDCSRRSRDGMRQDRMKRDGPEQEVKSRERNRKLLKKNIDYEILLHDYPYDGKNIDELLELMLDTVCSKRKEICIAGDDKPTEVVKSRLLSLNRMHIEYVLASLDENRSKVRNIKQYILSTLYNAPMTMSHYYEARVRSDNSI